MRKRFVAISMLGVALLFAQGGAFLIASLCPHLRSEKVSCEVRMDESEMSHEEMGHMEMQDESVQNLDQNALAIIPLKPPCSHCAVHSTKNQNSASVRETEVPQRSGDLSVPLQSPRIVPLTKPSVEELSSKAHGPPGPLTSRHILIGIFRI